MNNEKIELKPCPFCACEAVELNDLSRYFDSRFAVECSNCEAIGSPCDFQNDAVWAWNYRPNQDGDI